MVVFKQPLTVRGSWAGALCGRKTLVLYWRWARRSTSSSTTSEGAPGSPPIQH